MGRSIRQQVPGIAASPSSVGLWALAFAVILASSAQAGSIGPDATIGVSTVVDAAEPSASEVPNASTSASPSVLTTPASESKPLGAARTATPAGESGASDSANATRPSRSTISSAGAWFQTVAALGAVVALAFAGASAMRWIAGKRGGLAMAIGPAGRAPAGVIQVLGRYPLARGQTLILFKVGRRVLLVCQSNTGKLGGASMTTLSEIDDPDEVAHLLRLTRDEAGESAATIFRATLAREGFEPERDRDAERDRRGDDGAHPAIPRRVIAGDGGDRAELSGASPEHPTVPVRRAPGEVRGELRPSGAGSGTIGGVRGGDSSRVAIDGAEQLRRRLERLRSGGEGRIA